MSPFPYPVALQFHQHLWTALDWLFPPRCGGCGVLAERWCETCQQAIRRVPGKGCLRCGFPTPNGKLCLVCLSEPPSFERARAYAAFTGPIRKAIHRLKYKGDIGLGEALSKHLITYYTSLNWNIDLVTAVPLHPVKYRQRGYNQSALLALPVALSARRPFRAKALYRARETASQVGLSLRDRQKNVASAFMADPEIVAGKAVMVVDDVITTGVTLRECAKALRVAGAAKVYGLALARSTFGWEAPDPLT